MQVIPKKNRLVLVSAILILLVALFTSYISAETIKTNPQMAPANSEFLDHQGWLKERKLTTEYGKSLGRIPSPVDRSHLKGSVLEKRQSTLMYSPRYDLRDTGKVTPVRDQGACGACWAFGAIASMESDLLPSEKLDFSENNLKNKSGFDWGACDGGNDDMTTAYLTRWSGPVSETDDPFNPASDVSPAGLTPIKHIQEVIIIPDRAGHTFNDNIKWAVTTYGALTSSCYYDDAYFNSSTNSYYFNGASSSYYSNHEIAIVGWDDNYPASKFKTVPPGNGAFIAKNSWGTEWGEKGYFYISYYDSFIGTYNYIFEGAKDVTNYSNVYQYDPLGETAKLGYSSETAWFSNIFTATKSEQLKAVSFYNDALNSTYQIQIYTDVNKTPIDGTLSLTTNGTLDLPGYHTITLPTSVSLASGRKFSVVVRLTTPGYKYPIAVETPVEKYSSGATASSGQSFASPNGTKWDDVAALYTNTNVCLKAFTVAPAILITSPQNGETWTTASTHTITWTPSGLTQGGTLYFFYYDGASWQLVTSLPSTSTSYKWQVPGTPNSTAYIFVGYWVNNTWESADTKYLTIVDQEELRKAQSAISSYANLHSSTFGSTLGSVSQGSAGSNTYYVQWYQKGAILVWPDGYLYYWEQNLAFSWYPTTVRWK